VGLFTFFLTVFLGIGLYVVTFIGALFGAEHAGFVLNNGTVTLAAFAASLGLLALWPLAYVARWLWSKIRKRPMGPVRPDIIIPKWLIYSVQGSILAVIGAAIFFVAMTGFILLATRSYVPVLSEAPVLVGRAKFSSSMSDSLRVYEIQVLSSQGDSWNAEKQIGEVWLIELRRFSIEPWLRPILAKGRVQDGVRLWRLCYKVEPADPTIHACMDLGSEGLFEGMLASVASIFPGLTFEVHATSLVVPGVTTQSHDVNFVDGKAVFVGCEVLPAADPTSGSVDATVSTTAVAATGMTTATTSSASVTATTAASSDLN